MIYGLDENWLLSHPQVVDWSVEEQFFEIDRAGGVVVQAHPFREASYLPRIQLYPDYIHAIEGINTGNAKPVFNRRAVEFARQHHLPITGGSDTHDEHLSGGGMLFFSPIRGGEDFSRAIRDRRKALILKAETL